MIHPTSNLVTDVILINLMPYALPSATTWEEIAKIRQELPPSAPHTAVRFAHWVKKSKEGNNFVAYLTVSRRPHSQSVDVHQRLR